MVRAERLESEGTEVAGGAGGEEMSMDAKKSQDIQRAYRGRKKTLVALQERLRLERRNWHAVWVRDQVPSRAVREIIDELCDLAELEEMP